MNDTPRIDKFGRKWWEPIIDDDGKNDWLCDHLGDAQEKMDELWDEIIRLRRELAAANARIAGLEEENERLREDAERYRWLRDEFPRNILVALGADWKWWDEAEIRTDLRLDDFIDTKRKEGK